MRNVRITGTDLRPSALCLGTGAYGTAISQADAFAQLDTFCEAGGNFLDTAKVYGDWVPGHQSPSEKVIGAWLQSRRNCQDIVLATKGAHFHLDARHICRVTPGDIVSRFGGQSVPSANRLH